MDYSKFAKPDTGRKAPVWYTPEMWKLLAEAILLERDSKAENLEISLVQLANQAQKNQLKHLLGEDYGRAEWPVRNFTANVQLKQVATLIFQATQDLLLTAAACDSKEQLLKEEKQKQTDDLALISQLRGEIQRLTDQITTLEQQAKELKERRPPLSEYPAKEIAQAHFENQARQFIQMQELLMDAAIGKEMLQKATDQLEISSNQIEGNNDLMAKIMPTLSEVRTALALRVAVVQNAITPSAPPIPRVDRMAHHHKKR
jgi:DNA anti-recombination protein RmuC